MTTITMQDGTRIFYKDWGKGQPILFSHGWPLSADAWDAQMVFFANRGFRTIAHDRRSHGRSDQVWDNNTMDQYADDLAELLLDAHDAVLAAQRAAETYDIALMQRGPAEDTRPWASATVSACRCTRGRDSHVRRRTCCSRAWWSPSSPATTPDAPAPVPRP